MDDNNTLTTMENTTNANTTVYIPIPPSHIFYIRIHSSVYEDSKMNVDMVLTVLLKLFDLHQSSQKEYHQFCLQI